MKRWAWMIVAIITLLSGCGEKETTEPTPLPIGVADAVWLQEDGNDFQLVLGKDGTVSYYSPGAGNPYHDYDLCEKYTYNAENQEFSFDTNACSMKFIDISGDGKILRLLVDGDNITFHKEDSSE